MKRRIQTYDWQAWLGPKAHRREWLGWGGAALSVVAMLAATTAIAMQLERNEGLKDATENAVLLDLELPAPAPPALALSTPAPEVPQMDAPEADEPMEDTPEPPPEPVAEETPLPEPEEIAELPEPPKPDEVALPDAPPPPPPTMKPRERPERVVEREEPRREPEREAAAPPPQQRRQAAAPSQAQGTAQAPISAGQIQNLRAQWGGAIRTRIERRMRASRSTGTVTLNVQIARDGTLIGVALAKSSGDGALDSNAVRAAQSQGRFPAAPTGLTEASYTFTLPLVFKVR